MAGTIMIILVFGLMVSISMAYIKMVQTETQVQGMIDNSDRALDAAFSGVNMTIAILQSQKLTFTDSEVVAASRTYLIRNPVYALGDWGGINIFVPLPANFPNQFCNATASDWFYLDDKLNLFDYGETGSSTKPYQFRINSYPGTTNVGVIIPASYTIKAQGRFLVYGGDRVIATYTSQIIADCEINFSRKVVQLKRWRYMPFQSDTDFFKTVRY